MLAENFPTGQYVQAVKLLLDENEPAAHNVHEESPKLPEKEPLAHKVQALLEVAPAEAPKLPAGHILHVSPAILEEYVPALQIPQEEREET